MLETPHISGLDENVYEPAEDLYLLLDCFEQDIERLQKRRFPVVCEIGGGSGVVSAFLRMHIFPSGVFLATDVNPWACAAIETTMKQRANRGVADVFQASLTQAVRSNTVDVLVFNPPYVPAEEVPALPARTSDQTWLDLALLGGADGMVVTWQVLDGLAHILRPSGVAYILFCARNHPDAVKATMEERGWTVREVMTRKAGWEVLSVLEFSRGGD